MEASSTYPEPKSNLFYKTPSIIHITRNALLHFTKGRFKRCDNILYAIEYMVRNYSNNILRFVCFDVLLFTKCYSYNVDVDIKCKRKIKTKKYVNEVLITT